MARDTKDPSHDISQEWPAEKLMAIGALFLGSYLVFIYFVSP